MTSSFATYASQFLNRQRSPGAAASLTSEQPLFFSFSTDDGSPHNSGHAHRGDDSDLDDGGDPHLRTSENTDGLTTMANTRRDVPDDGDDPYLRLDEVDPGSQYPPASAASAHLLGSSHAPSEQSRGWLAHQPTQLRSPSPSSSELDESPPLPPSKARVPFTPSPPPPPPLSLSLTQSLLPRDGQTRPIDLFSLPDPRHMSRSRRKFHDPIWTSVWLTGLSICVFSSFLALFLTHKPSATPRSFPYTIFLHTVPLLVILTFTSAAASYAHILLLRVFVKPVVVGTSVFVPATLLISSIWAFTGSFMWDGDTVPTWGETWGLRLFSLVPLALALITGRRLLTLPQKIHSTSAVLTLTTRLLSSHPLLLLLSPAVLLATLLLSIPFVTLVFRLLLVGYTSRALSSSGVEWHIRGWANWAISGTILMWLWTWAVARGLLRVTTASVIAAWYFANPEAAPPPPMDTHRIHAALYRSSQPSLGSIALAGLLLTLTRMLLLLTVFLRRVPVYLPITLRMYTGPLLFAAGYLEDAAGSLSKYALVYVGITGEGFWVSARRARALVTSAESGAGRFKKNFKSEVPLTLLKIAPLSLTLPFSLIAYLFVAHTLGAPDQALEAAILAGTVTALVGLFCVGLVSDTADTLYLCYCIDKETGDRRRADVFELFEYNSRRQQQSQQQQRQQQTRVHRPQPAPPPAPHAPQPISQRVEGIVSPESSPELSPTAFQVDLEAGMRHPRSTRSRLPLPPQPVRQQTAHALRRQESSEMDPFLPDLDADVEPETEPEPEDGSHANDSMVQEGYDVESPCLASTGRLSEEGDEDEGMAGSALFPGSDLF